MMVDSTLVQVGKNLSEAMRILGNGDRALEDETEKRSFSRSIPGPLQGDGQDVATILHLVHNLIHEKEDEEKDQTSQCRMQNVGEQAHMALLGHSLAAYISVLDRERLRKLTTRIQSDTTLWLCRLFRYENSSAAFHEDDRDGLVKVCRLVINSQYEEYASEGYASLTSKQPVIYHSASGRSGLGQHLCSQLGLPLSSLCTVPCNTIFGSQHQMDVALLDKLIKEDVEAGKLPLLLIANAGTPGAGHTDKLGRLKDLCEQYNMWLHVEGVNLATLVLAEINSTIMAATRCDSMTLTPGQWLGLPAVTAVTLYRHEDPALSLAAGLTSSQPVAKLRALPLWLSLQYLGHNGIVQKIKHATSLSYQLLQKLKTLAFIRTSDVLETEISLSEALIMGKVRPIPPISGATLRDILGSLMLSIVEDELSSPVVLFRFGPELSAESNGGSVEGYCAGEKDVLDTFNKWLGERLIQLVPTSGVDVVELEDEGTCVRFSPLLTAAVLGTEQEDIDNLVEKLSELVSVMSSTLSLRQDFREEVHRHSPSLIYVEELSWPGLGAVRYEPQIDGIDESRRKEGVKKINSELLKKLQEFDTEITFSTGPEFSTETDDCIFVGMVTEDVDIIELVNMIGAIGKDIEESGRLLENMTDVIRKGILEAEVQLQKASEEKLMEEGVIRQLPLFGSVLNWFSPVQSSIKGRTFNLVAGSLDSTELTYSTKAQAGRPLPQEMPTSSTKRLSGQRLFQRVSAGTDSFSETSSIAQVEEPSRDGCASQSSSVHPPISLSAPRDDIAADATPQADSQIEVHVSSEEKQPEDQELDHSER